MPFENIGSSEQVPVIRCLRSLAALTALWSLSKAMLEYIGVSVNDVSIELLLEADPSEKSIQSYLEGSWCYVAKQDDRILGACIANVIGEGIAEIFNISVHPEAQKQGIGSTLLSFSLSELAANNIQRIVLGTGSFGYQLTFYQRLGFRVGAIIQDHFLLNYKEPIFENGLQHRDMLRLYLNIGEDR